MRGAAKLTTNVNSQGGVLRAPLLESFNTTSTIAAEMATARGSSAASAAAPAEACVTATLATSTATSANDVSAIQRSGAERSRYHASVWSIPTARVRRASPSWEPTKTVWLSE